MWTLTNSIKAQIAEKQCLYLLTNLSERQSYPHKMKVEFIAWILWSQNSQNSQILQSVVFKKKKKNFSNIAWKLHVCMTPPFPLQELLNGSQIQSINKWNSAEAVWKRNSSMECFPSSETLLENLEIEHCMNLPAKVNNQIVYHSIKYTWQNSKNFLN